MHVASRQPPNACWALGTSDDGAADTLEGSAPEQMAAGRGAKHCQPLPPAVRAGLDNCPSKVVRVLALCGNGRQLTLCLLHVA